MRFIQSTICEWMHDLHASSVDANCPTSWSIVYWLKSIGTMVLVVHLRSSVQVYCFVEEKKKAELIELIRILNVKK